MFLSVTGASAIARPVEKTVAACQRRVAASISAMTAAGNATLGRLHACTPSASPARMNHRICPRVSPSVRQASAAAVRNGSSAVCRSSDS